MRDKNKVFTVTEAQLAEAFAYAIKQADTKLADDKDQSLLIYGIGIGISLGVIEFLNQLNKENKEE